MISPDVEAKICEAIEDHMEICKALKIPDTIIQREIAIIAVSICIGADISPTPESRLDVDRIINSFMPVKHPKVKIWKP